MPSTDKLADPSLWVALAGIFGPGGIVLLLTNAAAYYMNYLMWGRLKEKDEECQRELAQASSQAADRANQMRDDIKEAFRAVADLSQKITVLVDRSAR